MHNKLSKCTYVVVEVDYLGNKISKRRVVPDLGKIKAVTEFPDPKTVKHVRSFWGSTGYYR